MYHVSCKLVVVVVVVVDMKFLSLFFPSIPISHWVKKRMLLRLLRGNSFLMIVSQQLIQEIDRLWRYQMLIVRIDKLTPRLPRVPSDQRFQVRIQLDPVLVQVRVQFLRAQHLCNPDQLVIIVVAVKKRLLTKNHPGEHAPQRPQIQRVIVILQIHQP